jgi:diacylglycerol kinase (ATP)
MIVLVNTRACGGRAAERWLSLAPRLRRRPRKFTAIMLGGEIPLHGTIRDALCHGEREFVAAGGDGTVNALVSCLLSCAAREEIPEIAVGAIGLGSSNDFHKPFCPDSMLDGLPAKLDFDCAAYRDVGRIDFESEGGSGTRYFLVNASAGVTAVANRFFNSPDRILRILKGASTPAAIAYAAIRTILTYQSQQMTLWSAETSTITGPLTNIGFVKNPHFSGSLSYPGEAEYDSGKVVVHVCPAMDKAGLFRLLRALSNGTFDAIPGIRSWSTESISIISPVPFPIEHDGEVVTALSARISILHRHLKVCP